MQHTVARCGGASGGRVASSEQRANAVQDAHGLWPCLSWRLPRGRLRLFWRRLPENQPRGNIRHQRAVSLGISWLKDEACGVAGLNTRETAVQRDAFELEPAFRRSTNGSVFAEFGNLLLEDEQRMQLIERKNERFVDAGALDRDFVLLNGDQFAAHALACREQQ